MRKLLFVAVLFQSCSGFTERKYLDWHISRNTENGQFQQETICSAESKELKSTCALSAVRSESQINLALPDSAVHVDGNTTESEISEFIQSDEEVILHRKEETVSPDPDEDSSTALGAAATAFFGLAILVFSIPLKTLIVIGVTISVFAPLIILISLISLILFFIRVSNGSYRFEWKGRVYATCIILLGDILLLVAIAQKEMLFWMPGAKQHRKDRRARRKIF